MPINWCTSCKVGLANEEVVGGVCERCGGEVVRKVKSQWMLRITDYAQKLLDGLDSVDFIEKVKTQQRNWIGRSARAQRWIFSSPAGDKLRVYTTRPDTLFGATYMVVSPEHPMLETHKDKIENYSQIADYRSQAAQKSDFERTELNKEKTGVEIHGVRAINPVNGKEIPIWVSDYVLMGYGTGAIMAVPGHDTRDWEFAHRSSACPSSKWWQAEMWSSEAYTDIQDGVLVNSGMLDGLTCGGSQEKDYCLAGRAGHWRTQGELTSCATGYFSRQRYWGEPIPLVKCDAMRLGAGCPMSSCP